MQTGRKGSRKILRRASGVSSALAAEASVSAEEALKHEFLSVTALKLGPLGRIVAEPSAQHRARRDILQPDVSTAASCLFSPRGQSLSTRMRVPSLSTLGS
ncbi:hypothetical protein GGI55_005553 [Rhizobium leguminosarum]|nr:hypothetical protein [Rhizobium esperanzae]MBB4544852.1 hypothetical protein [Rhizobium leguminosarum]MBB5653378.1 hypothetical protein [Rhizobium leguminosarum]MBB6268207.1 hypothetical protein [Rhizobium leguminosarum]